jgi:methyltransferase (TIGR00027 family)
MPRSEDDNWNLASSVGVMATMVATARAIVSRTEQPLIEDPFAEPLVRAVGIDVFTRLASGELLTKDLDGDEAGGMRWIADNMAIRTKYYDDYFLDATQAGIRQAVILASGLDSRAYRLPWPAGTTVFEIDQPEVIEFKTQTLAALDATPSADHRPVGADLRFDWPKALRDAGFDPQVPTVWSAEALLGYLQPDAQDQVLVTVTELSGPGSRVATETRTNFNAPAHDAHSTNHSEVIERMQRMAERWREHGFDFNLRELVYFSERSAEAFLADLGWTLTGTSINELFHANGLPPLPEGSSFSSLRYISGELKQTPEGRG